MKQQNYQKYVKKNIKNYILDMNISEKKYGNLLIQYNRTRKTKLIRAKKRKIVIPQDFEETKSEKSDEENEEEEQTEEESEVDEAIFRKKKTKRKSISKKKSSKETTKKQVRIIDYIDK